MTDSIELLILEDDDGQRNTMTRNFREFNFSVDAVSHGMEAIEYVKTHPSLDVILADVNMDGPIDGLEAVEEIQKHSRDIGTIFLSGHYEKADFLENLSRHQVRMGCWFSKPLNRAKIDLVVEAIKQEKEKSDIRAYIEDSRRFGDDFEVCFRHLVQLRGPFNEEAILAVRKEYEYSPDPKITELTEELDLLETSSDDLARQSELRTLIFELQSHEAKKIAATVSKRSIVNPDEISDELSEIRKRVSQWPFEQT